MRRRQLFQQLEYTHVTHEDILVSVHDIIIFDTFWHFRSMFILKIVKKGWSNGPNHFDIPLLLVLLAVCTLLVVVHLIDFDWQSAGLRYWTSCLVIMTDDPARIRHQGLCLDQIYMDMVIWWKIRRSSMSVASSTVACQLTSATNFC